MDFGLIRYNLYEFIGVDEDSDIKTIKKAYRKLILKYHPDKNNGLIEDDIYDHIKYVNMVLLNEKLRDEYDDYLLNDAQKDFFSLKKQNKDEYDFKMTKDEALIQFLNDEERLKKLHGEIEPTESTMVKYKNYKKEEIKVDKTDYNKIKNDNSKFNTEFNNKILNGTSTELINVSNNGLNEAYVNRYMALDSYGKLYSTGSTSTSSYTSLDAAFKVAPSVEQLLDRKLSKLEKK